MMLVRFERNLMKPFGKLEKKLNFKKKNNMRETLAIVGVVKKKVN